LLSKLKLHCNRNFIIALAALSVLFSAANPVHAIGRGGPQEVTYRTQLGADLDGDHLPETVTVRLRAYSYKLSIHFTTGRPKLRLKTYVSQDLAGLSVQTTDVNNDNKRDLVVVSATSLRPIAVWLNQDKAKFKRVNASVYSGVSRFRGPTYGCPLAFGPEPVGNIFIDPLPQAMPSIEYFGLNNDSAVLLHGQTDRPPFDSVSRQVPTRGPPARPRW